jgi:alpha-N-acetylglucosaminidase
MVNAIPKCEKSDGFQYDLVDITRQVLANYALPLQQEMAKAYRENDRVKFDKLSGEFIELIDDMDRLLATRQDFLLGTWVADARNCGTTEAEKALYEQNAKDLITLWGDANNRLFEYSNRQWSGLLSDFYKPRWQRFFSDVKANWGKFDQAAFDENIKQWEWSWVVSRKDYPVKPAGSPTKIASQLYQKYVNRIIPLTKVMAPIKYDY